LIKHDLAGTEIFMVLLNADLYERTKQLLLEEVDKSPLLVDFADWMRQKYAVNLLNFEFARIDNPNNSQRLYLILNSKSDVQKLRVAQFKPNLIIDKAVSEHFRRLARQHGHPDQPPLDKFFVAYADYSEEARSVANWQAVEEAKPVIKDTFPAVWDVLTIFSSTVVFYFQDAQIQELEASGVSASISEHYYQILKKYDELGYCTTDNFSIKFDSKQNVDENYEGSLFYYSR
jgi:hypothetical protein